MSSSWILKTRQMSEAGKEILLREGLAAHMRSVRDRQQLMEMLEAPRPIEDIYSFFAAFWLYHYQGVRLLSFDEAQELTIERKDEMTREERRQLELEIRQLLGEKHREEIDMLRLQSEFIMALCETPNLLNPLDVNSINNCVTVLKEHLTQIPEEYCVNHDIDFVLSLTGWAKKWRDELYAKASGLKESAMSLRDELMREHPSEVIEITILRRGLRTILGTDEYARGHLIELDIPDATWKTIAQAILENLSGLSKDPEFLIKAHELRIRVLELFELEFDSPTTINSYEQSLGTGMAQILGEAIKEDPTHAYDLLSVILGLPASDIAAALRSKGIRDPALLGDGLLSSAEPPETETEGPHLSQEEIEDLERSLRRLEKIETTLEKSVKGMLKAQGLRASELDKITIEFLTKDRSELIGIEIKVLEALKKKLRVPSPQEMRDLLVIRKQVEQGSLRSIGMKSATEMIQQRKYAEAIEALKLDMVWHFTINLLTNLTRVVETYIRSKQDLLRIKALLKSIYEEADAEMQSLREEILIDLTAKRIYELKCVHPELDATTICSWLHARFSNQDLSSAREELETTPSPVFMGVIDVPLRLDGLEFDNYAIAYDLMHRFLAKERLAKLAKEEYALEVEMERKRVIAGKRAKIDLISWIDTKSKTVFRAIARVGSRGLEWSPNDEMKCANLLAYFVNQNRGRVVCTICGSYATDGKCKTHGTRGTTKAGDMEILTVLVMRSITAIKTSLIGPKAEPMSWDQARAIVQRVISELKRRGKLTSKTNLNQLLPGELNQIVGPAIAKVIGKYFNESLEYAARRSDLA